MICVFLQYQHTPNSSYTAYSSFNSNLLGDEMGRFEGGSAFLLVFQLEKSKIHENRSNHEDGRQSNGSEEAKEHSAVAENVHQPKDDQNEAAEIGSSDMVWSVSPPQFVTYGSPLSHLC